MVKNNKLRVVYFDIETSALRGYYYGKKWETNIIKTDRQDILLSIAWKVKGEKKIYVKSLADYPNYRRNKLFDMALVKDLHALFSTTDVLIAFNGDRFDIRKANNFFIRNGLKPVSVFKTIDPLKIARKHFDFTSNSLNDLAEMFGIGSKIDNDKDLSFKCLNGDLGAWRKMKLYNAHDVHLLEQVFLKLAPWANLTQIEKQEESSVCLVCRGRLVKDGHKMRVSGKRQIYRCVQCGHCSNRSA